LILLFNNNISSLISYIFKYDIQIIFLLSFLNRKNQIVYNIGSSDLPSLIMLRNIEVKVNKNVIKFNKNINMKFDNI